LTVLDQAYSSSELELIHDRLIISAKQRKDKKIRNIDLLIEQAVMKYTLSMKWEE